MCPCHVRPSVKDAPFHRGDVMMVVRVCVQIICECPHGMYLVLYAAHDPLVGASPPSWAGLTHIYIHIHIITQ